MQTPTPTANQLLVFSVLPLRGFNAATETLSPQAAFVVLPAVNSNL